jgi:hypothetical protein
LYSYASAVLEIVHELGNGIEADYVLSVCNKVGEGVHVIIVWLAVS